MSQPTPGTQQLCGKCRLLPAVTSRIVGKGKFAHRIHLCTLCNHLRNKGRKPMAKAA